MMTETIDTATLRKMLEAHEPVTVLDVRPAEERADWAIPGSRHVDAYDALNADDDPDALAGVDLSRDRPVVTVCGAGKTSLVAAEHLRARGLEAASLKGGMRAWSLAWNTAEIPIPESPARVLQVRRTGKGCLSYLVASNRSAVVDPALAPDVYLELAREQGWTITDVLDTHVHADHVSRSRPLAERVGATLHLPAQERVSCEYSPIRDGDVLEIGASRLEALHTPGHTVESTSYLLDGKALFTGDTLFTGVRGVCHR